MFCPQCGSTQSDDLKFCKTCGANLHALRKVMASREESDEKFDWSKTWVAEIFDGSERAVARSARLERLQGRTPEVKRRIEMKAGVITASVGAGLMIFLFALMEGIIASGRISDAAAAIISRIWLVGLIPLLVGLALVFNGAVISRGEASSGSEPDHGPNTRELTSGTTPEQFLPAPDTNDLSPADIFSVTDETTKHLKVRR